MEYSSIFRSLIQHFEMVDHISNLWKLQEELHIMGSPVPDEDFVMILVTSLPESWDNYTLAYLVSSGNKLELQSHEIIAILLDDREWHGYGKPQGKLMGFAGVGVWVGGFIPQQNMYLHHR